MKKSLLLSILTGMLAIALAFGLVACTEEAPQGGALTLNQTSLSLNVGGGAGTITATTASGEEVNWSIEDPAVASITTFKNVCLVRPLKEGTTTLTATLGEDKATCTITVGAPVEVETVTIMQNGTALAADATLTVERGGTLTLSATASKGSAVNWSTSSESVASVSNGVVTANIPGTAVITAYVTASIKATVTVNVTAPEGAEFYNLPIAAEDDTVSIDGNDTPITTDMYYFWHAKATYGQQEVSMEYCYYDAGKISFKYTSDWDPGYWFGFQMFYKSGTQTPGANYKLTCKMTVDRNCYVTLNNNVISLNEGANNVTAYYICPDNGTAFSLIMGYPIGNTNGYFVQNVEMSISDIHWEADTPVKLAAPTFTYNGETGVIDITDPNTAGVGGYMLTFYKDGAAKGSVEVKSGEKIDASKMANDTYTVKLMAFGENVHYIDSDISATEATVTVNNVGGPSYDLEFRVESDAVKTPGVWYYWTSPWVEFTGEYANGKVTATFGNNKGWWYDTQLFYLAPEAKAGGTYEITLTITAPNAGKITICGTEVQLAQGTADYTITTTQASGKATVAMVFGIVDKNDGQQEIQDGTVEVALKSITETSAPSGGEQGGSELDPANYEEGQTYDATYASLANGDEASMAANTWTYWYVQDTNWNCGSVVTMNTNTLENNVITLGWTGGSVDFCVQLFYKNSSLTNGKVYKLTCKINSSDAREVKINDKYFDLVAGDNNIEVIFTLGDISAFDAQFNTAASGATVKVSEVKWTEMIATGGNGGQPSGGESQSEYTLAVKTDTNFINNPGVWYYWTSDWVVFSGNYKDDAVTVTFSNNAGNWYDTQLFYRAPTAQSGATYDITLTITSTSAGRITICGTVVTLTAGTNDYTVAFTQGAAETIVIVFGVYPEDNAQDIQSGTVTIAIKSITDKSGNGGQSGGSGNEQGGGNEQGQGGQQGGEQGTPDTSNAVTATLTLDSVYGDGQYFFFWATCDYDLTTVTKITVNGTAADWIEISPKAGDGRYPVRIKCDTTQSSYTILFYVGDNVVAQATYTAAG